MQMEGPRIREGGVVATGLIAIMDADGQGQAQEMIYRYLTTLDA